MFKNFQSFTWALKDYCIQEGFKCKKTKFERRRVACKCYTDKCPFKVYAALQKFGQCSQIRTLHNIHTCEGLVKSPKVIVGYIVREYKNKVVGDLKIGVGNLVDDLRTMYRVEVQL